MLICPPYNSSTIFVNFIEFYVSDKIDLNYKFIYFPQKKIKKNQQKKEKKEGNLNLIQTKKVNKQDEFHPDLVNEEQSTSTQSWILGFNVASNFYLISILVFRLIR